LHVEEFIPKLKERRVKRVEINNHGETTIINGWEKVAAKLLEASFEVSITSNLAKSFSDEEITALANMTVYLSIDAVDPELFRKLRLGARLERVLENVRRIQLRKKELNISKPFGWRTILCDATYPGVLELINLGLQLGVTEFYFGHLQKMMVLNHLLT
jgi:MoaA/NifB/PqqE/SkfB family radical SAM enzyme